MRPIIKKKKKKGISNASTNFHGMMSSYVI